MEYAVDPVGAFIESGSEHQAVLLWSSYKERFVQDVEVTYQLQPTGQERPNVVHLDLVGYSDTRFDKLDIDIGSQWMQKFFTKAVLTAAIKESGQAFEQAKDSCVVRMRKEVSELTKMDFNRLEGTPMFPKRRTPLDDKFDDFAKAGRLAGGILVPKQPRPEEEVMRELNQKYGSDPILVQMLKQARASGTDDDAAEVRNRCRWYYTQSLAREALQGLVINTTQQVPDASS